MIRICPLPLAWAEIVRQLSKISSLNPEIPSPPIALILGGWNFSDDFEKKNRWDATVEWAEKFGGNELIYQLNDADFYYVDEMSRPDYLDYQWGETSQPAVKPTEETLTALIQKVITLWGEIAGSDSSYSKPSNFSGAKARSLIVEYDTEELPSWGTWGKDPGGYRDQKFTDRPSFTALRRKINDVIQPHKVDHIVFQRKK
jgi:hypothetical protein